MVNRSRSEFYRHIAASSGRGRTRAKGGDERRQLFVTVIALEEARREYRDEDGRIFRSRQDRSVPDEPGLQPALIEKHDNIVISKAVYFLAEILLKLADPSLITAAEADEHVIRMLMRKF